jgi:hypothetical protein
MATVAPASIDAEQHISLCETPDRVLDKGVVIAGDIKIKLVDIELLTIQIRLMIASVEKAKEMGMDWWRTNPEFTSQADPEGPRREEERRQLDALRQEEMALLKGRLERLEAATPHC